MIIHIDLTGCPSIGLAKRFLHLPKRRVLGLISTAQLTARTRWRSDDRSMDQRSPPPGRAYLFAPDRTPASIAFLTAALSAPITRRWRSGCPWQLFAKSILRSVALGHHATDRRSIP